MMVRTREYQALFDACAREGCILCRILYESTTRYLDTWKYELFTDVDIRKELRKAHGFCHTHTWQLARMGAALPIAQAYQEIVSDAIEQLQYTQESMQPTGGLLRRLFEPKREHVRAEKRCLACIQRAQVEERYIHSLQQAITDAEFTQQFKSSHGLCLTHFRLTCEHHFPDISGNWLYALREGQLNCLQRLDTQLQELIRKHDYRFHEELRGEEMVSWKRAAGFVAGEEQQ